MSPGKNIEQTFDPCTSLLSSTNDPEIDAEHGMISFKAEQLLYVNSSDKPTKLDDVDVDAEAGPTNLKNGAVLKIGNLF